MAESQTSNAASVTNTPAPNTVVRSDGVLSPNYRKDPYYLHPSDNPGLSLVSCPLDLKNYLCWRRSMLIALQAKNKVVFVDGSLSKPIDEDSDDFSSWIFVDSMVTSWLLNSMSKDLSEAYMYASSARELWFELEEKFGEVDKPRVFKLRKQLISTVQGTDSIALYSNKLKKIWSELQVLDPRPTCTCSAARKYDDKFNSNVVMQFLMGLNEVYDSAVSNILMMDPLPTYNKTYSMISRIENQKDVSVLLTSTAVESSAMAVKFSSVPRNSTAPASYNSSKKNNKADRFCVHCRKSGHLEEACFKKHGYPDWFKDYKKDQSKNTTAYAHAVNEVSDMSDCKNQDVDRQSISEMVQEEFKKLVKGKSSVEDTPLAASYLADFAGMISPSTKIPEIRWIIDSGASNHICSDLSLMTGLRKISGKNTVQIPDGSLRFVKLVGNAVLHKNLVLYDVLFVPDFKYNPISVAKLLMHSDKQLIFDGTRCLLQDQSSKWEIGRNTGHLYFFEGISEVSADNKILCNAVSSKIDNSSNLWHNRLGHPSDKVLQNLPFPCNSQNKICDVCHHAKQSRLLFQRSCNSAEHIFELLHIDVWGPYGVPSLSGARFLLTIVDAFSRAVWVYLMKTKCQVSGLLTQFFAYVKNHFDTTVKTVRTDNGSEFLSLNCQKLFAEHGVLHQRTCVYTPQQNGIVERKHRHLIQVARALLFQGGLSHKFWGEAVLHTAYLINLLPSVVLNWVSPYEKLHGKVPSFDQLKVFGCLVFATVVGPHQRKFDSRARKCIFLGYISGCKGFKLYDLTARTFFGI